MTVHNRIGDAEIFISTILSLIYMKKKSLQYVITKFCKIFRKHNTYELNVSTKKAKQ